MSYHDAGMEALDVQPFNCRPEVPAGFTACERGVHKMSSGCHGLHAILLSVERVPQSLRGGELMAEAGAMLRGLPRIRKVLATVGRLSGGLLALVLLFAAGSGRLLAQQNSGPRGVVTFVSASGVYASRGASSGISTGDTMIVLKRPMPAIRLIVNAVSSGSSVAPFAPTAGQIRVGDSVEFHLRPPQTIISAKPDTESVVVRKSVVVPTSPVATPNPQDGHDPLVRGRVALQYAGAGQFGKQMDISEPSLLLRLDVSRLFDDDLSFSMYGRTSYDVSENYSRWGIGSRSRNRLYEMAFSYHPAEGVGGDAGRIVSQFAGGMGQLDGAQVYMKTGELAFGVLAGTQPDYTTSGFDFTQQRGSAFINLTFNEKDYANRKSLTAAYGRQLHEGRFDRDFLYTQVSAQFGSEISFYENSEIDLHTLSNETAASGFSLTNTFVSLSYTPMDWVTMTGGFDASRSIYLFDSMKSIADSLLDRELREGFRGSLSLRLPFKLLLMMNGTYRMKTANTRDSHTLGSNLRTYDLLGSGVSMGAGYMRIVGAYTTGNEYSADADWWFTQMMSFSVRFDQYTYQLVVTGDQNTTTTLTGMFNLRFSRSFYAMISFDQVWDSVRNSQRAFVEAGYQF
jgi:hypothetical protein